MIKLAASAASLGFAGGTPSSTIRNDGSRVPLGEALQAEKLDFQAVIKLAASAASLAAEKIVKHKGKTHSKS